MGVSRFLAAGFAGAAGGYRSGRSAPEGPNRGTAARERTSRP
jgi:hypothetical protein